MYITAKVTPCLHVWLENVQFPQRLTSVNVCIRLMLPVFMNLRHCAASVCKALKRCRDGANICSELS